jgi:hypothetical protein
MKGGEMKVYRLLIVRVIIFATLISTSSVQGEPLQEVPLPPELVADGLDDAIADFYSAIENEKLYEIVSFLHPEVTARSDVRPLLAMWIRDLRKGESTLGPARIVRVCPLISARSARVVGAERGYSGALVGMLFRGSQDSARATSDLWMLHDVGGVKKWMVTPDWIGAFTQDPEIRIGFPIVNGVEYNPFKDQ